MRKFFTALIVLMGLSWGMPALATNNVWVTQPGGTTPCAPSIHGVCFLDTTTTGRTPILKGMQNCDLTASWVSDIADVADFVNTTQVFRFFGLPTITTPSDDNAATWLANALLDGDSSTATDTSAIYHFPATHGLYYNVTVCSGGTCRAIVECVLGG